MYLDLYYVDMKYIRNLSKITSTCTQYHRSTPARNSPTVGLFVQSAALLARHQNCRVV